MIRENKQNSYNEIIARQEDGDILASWTFDTDINDLVLCRCYTYLQDIKKFDKRHNIKTTYYFEFQKINTDNKHYLEIQEIYYIKIYKYRNKLKWKEIK